MFIVLNLVILKKRGAEYGECIEHVQSSLGFQGISWWISGVSNLSNFALNCYEIIKK